MFKILNNSHPPSLFIDLFPRKTFFRLITFSHQNQKWIFTWLLSLNSILTSLKWRFKQITTLSNDFEYLCGTKLSSIDFDEIKKWTSDLAIKYTKYLNGFELCFKTECFKHQVGLMLWWLISKRMLRLIY